MAKPSRSKQPDFDPTELEDLIFTPAVGSGVGSHLIRPPSPPPPQTPAVPPPSETVPTTVARPNLTTVVPSERTPARKPNKISALADWDAVSQDVATVDSPNVTTVATSAPTSTANLELWVTETGELVPKSRVRRIRLAQDVLNAAEESVYDILWNTKSEQRSELDSYKVVQAGYDYLMKRSRLSKKTIQRIIDRLADKDFISIERPADIYTRTSTTYRVYSYRAVLDRHAAKDRLFAVKIGPGFLFARRVETPPPTPPANNMTTVDKLTTVDRFNQTTGVNMTTPTVPSSNLTTVVGETTAFIRQNFEEETSSSSSAAVSELRQLLQPILPNVDDDAVKVLVRDCRARAGDCTAEEIAYFVEQKLRMVRNVHNPVGFVLSAVPRHFQAQGHLAVREMLRRQAEQRAREWADTHAFWSAIAEDPGAPPEDREQARSILQGLEESSDAPKCSAAPWTGERHS